LDSQLASYKVASETSDAVTNASFYPAASHNSAILIKEKLREVETHLSPECVCLSRNTNSV